jgi:hypothetical protein
VSVQVRHEDDRWIAYCGHCGGRITAQGSRADLDATLAALGVPDERAATTPSDTGSASPDDHGPYWTTFGDQTRGVS